MTRLAHAHAPAHAPFPVAHAHGRGLANNVAGQALTAPLTQRSRPSRPLTLTIPSFFRRGIRERRMTRDGNG